jgi:hypothetical protein
LSWVAVAVAVIIKVAQVVQELLFLTQASP